MSGELSMPTTCAPSATSFFGQCPVATTQIEDAFARPGLEQIQNRLPERGHEMGIIGVGSRIPVLGGC
jgi:hypothetical protein